MAPLEREVNGLVSRPDLKRLRGLAGVSSTTVEVLSGRTAKVTGSAVSYFDVAEAPKLDKKTLDSATEISDGLGTALFPTGAPTDGTNALGTVWGSALGLPAYRVAGLALALGEERRRWSVLTEGAELTITPHVLPGGRLGEIDVVVEVAHGKPGGEDPTVSTSETAEHLTRVAQHKADTEFYLETMDVFTLSTFNLRTVHPRPKFAVPIVGQLPILGRMFRFHRSPRKVHHESVLAIQATIVPCASDVIPRIETEIRRADAE